MLNVNCDRRPETAFISLSYSGAHSQENDSSCKEANLGRIGNIGLRVYDYCYSSRYSCQ